MLSPTLDGAITCGPYRTDYLFYKAVDLAARFDIKLFKSNVAMKMPH